MSAHAWAPLLAELDRWSDAGLRLRLWLRDDDAVAPSPALARLSDVAERFDIPVLLAVIPLLAEPELAPALRTMPRLLPCQHGVSHRNHAPPGAKKCEFGAERAPDIVRADITDAARRLRDRLGEAIVPVFVPPWNRIATDHATALPALGFQALSCFRGHPTSGDGAPFQLDTDLDVMDWQGGRIGRSHADLVAELAALLADRRGRALHDRPLGILLHHRDHDETVWSFLETLLRLGSDHPAIVLADPRVLIRAGTGGNLR